MFDNTKSLRRKALTGDTDRHTVRHGVADTLRLHWSLRLVESSTLDGSVAVRHAVSGAALRASLSGGRHGH